MKDSLKQKRIQIYTLYSGVTNVVVAGQIERSGVHRRKISNWLKDNAPGVHKAHLKKYDSLFCHMMIRAVGPLARLLEHVYRRIYEVLEYNTVTLDLERMRSSFSRFFEDYHFSWLTEVGVYVNIFTPEMAQALNGKHPSTAYHLQSYSQRFRAWSAGAFSEYRSCRRILEIVV